MKADHAGYLNDPAQARRVVKEGGSPNRRCRWCNSQLTRIPQGAVICSGYCDVPDPDPEVYFGRY